ncbi:transcription factor domain-containing protein [Aspergillus undulatus]|uniref:transcription factor domain-containing protein n=1 Tax=Aspergillus undulatus TaxID=1810928 RepID=UPI003CCCB9A6
MQHSVPGARVMPAWRMRDTKSHIRENPTTGIGHVSRSRQRKPLACEACHQRKTKCEYGRSSDTCIRCMRRNLNCKTLSGKGTRDSQKRSRYVKSLEERLRKTESLLRAAGISVEPADLDTSGTSDEAEDDSTAEDDHDVSGCRPGPGRRSTNPPSASDGRDSPMRRDSKQSFCFNDPSALFECKRSTTQKSSEPPTYKAEKENSLYIGRSTPLSILTREGVEWIKSRSGEENSLNTLLSNSKFDSPWAHWRPDVFYDVFSSQVFKPLPPRAEVFSLLRDFFQTVNFIFPLYHEETFMQLVEWQYTQQTCDDAARWASINVIIALAYEYRFSNSQKSDKDREKAWLYYKNALSVFPELVLRRTDLLSVQALLGMAIFLRGNSGSQSTVPIITAAIRASHRMGLHREIPRPHLSLVEQQQRRNVFWIAYVLDQSISIRLGTAPTQHFDDFDVEIPSDETVHGLMMADNKAFFPQVCRIAVIRSRIYRHFYSARALENKSTADICEMVHNLHAELQEWKKTSQFETLIKQRGTDEDYLAGFASAGLFLMYYNSLIMIHRLPLMLNFVYQSRADSIPEIELRLMLKQSTSSAAVCVQAARDTLKLVNNLPWGDIAWIWSLLYYVFLAVMTLFAYILRNSHQPTAKDDLQSLNMAATFFATLEPADGPCNYARWMTRMSTSFERIARAVFERDQKALSVRPATVSKSKHSKPRGAQAPPPHSHSHSEPTSTSTSPPTSTSINIPNLEGLPPINSSGYVVPESPSASSTPAQTSPNELDHKNTSHQSTHAIKPEHRHSTSNSKNIQYQQPLSYAATTMPTPTDPTANPNIDLSFPLPALEEGGPFAFSFPQPELWQIPLTADWEFGLGSQFLSNMLGHPGNMDPNLNVNPHVNSNGMGTPSTGAGVGAGPGPSHDHNQTQSYVFHGGGGSGGGTAFDGSAMPACTVPAPMTAVPISHPSVQTSNPNHPMTGTSSVGFGYGGGVPGNPTAHAVHSAVPSPRPPNMWMGGGCGGSAY